MYHLGPTILLLVLSLFPGNTRLSNVDINKVKSALCAFSQHEGKAMSLQISNSNTDQWRMLMFIKLYAVFYKEQTLNWYSVYCVYLMTPSLQNPDMNRTIILNLLEGSWIYMSCYGSDTIRDHISCYNKKYVLCNCLH